MNYTKRIIGIATGIVALVGTAHADTTLVAGPTGYFFTAGSNDAYCMVLNTGTAPMDVVIDARDDSGIAKASKVVTLVPEQGATLAGGDEVSSCAFRSQSKRMVGMLIASDPVTGVYLNVIPARR